MTMQLAVTYGCGHTVVERRFGGKYEEQLAKARRMLCPECYRAERRAEAAKAVEGIELAALTGTEKQVAWAEDIRARFVLELRAKYPVNNDGMAKLLAALNRRTAASWWIDRRNWTLTQVCNEVIKEDGLV